MIDQAPEIVHQPQNWMQLVYMAIIVIVAQVPIWIREFNKYRDFQKKNGQLAEIKSGVVASQEGIQRLQKGQVKLARDMAAQVIVCQTISGPLKEQVSKNQKNILDIIKEKGN